MRSPFLYLKNVIGVGFKKLRYGSHFSAGLIQTFSGLHTEIYKKGRIKMGAYNQNRGQLYLVADGGEINIGSHCFFNTGCCVTAVESVKIGDDCKFGNNVVIVDHDHNFKNIGNSEFISTPVTIGNDNWIGANVTILRGTTIGNNCVIGAGSVIKGKIVDGSKIIQKK
ncbi:acyltransferase [Butyrivibrio proteoclasticus]|uniref:acyltransferase n=1 Tax=Butyrivibrio proteoclasticus TaxID=43305 RepID=UPI0006865480|nr:acyltransferase [Butyrivibrio proteoclasticus]